MNNVPEKIKELIKKDGIKNNFRVHFTDGSLPDIINDNIIEESVRLSESICDNAELIFGLAPFPQIEFETIGIGNIKGKEIECSIEVDARSLAYKILDGNHIYKDDPRFDDISGEVHYPSYVTIPDDLSYPVYSIPYGSFTVDECKKQIDMSRRRVVATFSEDQLIKTSSMSNFIETLKRTAFPMQCLSTSPSTDPFAPVQGVFGIAIEDILTMIFPEYAIAQSTGDDYFTRIGNFESEKSHHDSVKVSKEGYVYEKVEYGFPMVGEPGIVYVYERTNETRIWVDDHYEPFDPDYTITFYYGIKTQQFCSGEGYSVTTFYSDDINDDFKNFLKNYDEELVNEHYLCPRLFDYTAPGGLAVAAMFLDGDRGYLSLISKGFDPVEKRTFELDKPFSSMEILTDPKEMYSVVNGMHVEYGSKMTADFDQKFKILPGCVELAFLEAIYIDYRDGTQIIFEPETVNGNIYYHTNETLLNGQSSKDFIFFSIYGTHNDYYSNGYNPLQPQKPGQIAIFAPLAAMPEETINDYDWTYILSSTAQYLNYIIRVKGQKLELVDLSEKFSNENKETIYKNMYEKIWYEDVYSKPYKWFGGTYTSNFNNVNQDVKVNVDESLEDNKRMFRIENIEMINSNVYSETSIRELLNHTKSRLKGITYLPMQLTMSGRPDLDVGDVVLVETDNGMDVMLIERRELKGIDHLVDSITSEDEEASFSSGSKSGKYIYNDNTETLVIN